MSLRRLRRLRRPLIRVLAPALMASWITAAAAPCMAMASDEPAASVVDATHPHHMSPASDLRSARSEHHPPCPHCGPLSSGHASEDAATHALCASGEAAGVKDASAKLAKRDLAVGPPDFRPDGSALPVVYLIGRLARNADPPIPSLPRHLRFCVFLN